MKFSLHLPKTIPHSLLLAIAGSLAVHASHAALVGTHLPTFNAFDPEPMPSSTP